MMGQPQRGESKLFYTQINLEERMPANHPLRRVAAAIDFRLVRKEVEACYGYNGQESIDPTVILKLLYLAFAENLRSERELMRQLPVRLDWLWFCQMDIDDPIPDHSVLSKARQRWGLEVFERIFNHILIQCVKAGLVDGQTVHADSTVLKANASVESRIPRILWEQLDQSQRDLEPRPPKVEPHLVSEAQAEDDHRAHNDPPDAEDEGEDGGKGTATFRRATSPQDTQVHDLPPPSQGKFNARTVSRTIRRRRRPAAGDAR